MDGALTGFCLSSPLVLIHMLTYLVSTCWFFLSFLGPFGNKFLGIFISFPYAPPPPSPPTYLLKNCMPTLITPTYLLSFQLLIYLPTHLPTYPPSPSLLTNKVGTYKTYQIINRPFVLSITVTLQLSKMMMEWTRWRYCKQFKVRIRIRVQVWDSLLMGINF
jgi:hypothetical protein